MPSGNRPPAGPGQGGMFRFVIIMALVLLGLFLFFRWNYQVNLENAENGDDSAPVTISEVLPLT